MSGLKPADCDHQHLSFDRGGLHLVCGRCRQIWRAVQGDGVVPAYEARGWGFSNRDRRVDPFEPHPAT